MEYGATETTSVTFTPEAPTTVVSTNASPAAGVEGVGQTITLTLTMSRPVTIAGGTPTLLLNDGGTATYDAAATAGLNDPTKLVFDYTVSSTDQTVATLAVAGGSLNGASILDGAGNTPDFSNVLVSFPNLSVFIPPATVTSVVASPASGVEGIGQTIIFTLTMSKAVTVSGATPTLSLNDGGTATYDAAATAALGDPTKLVCTYTTSASDHNAAALAIIGGNLNGATVQDASGHEANFSGALTSFPALQIAVLPAVTSVVATPAIALPAGGIEGVGATISFTVTLNKAVTVSGGIPTLALNDGGTATLDPLATAALGDPTKLVFSYTVASTDNDVAALAVVGGSLNGATVRDAAGAQADFSGVLTLFPEIPVATTAGNSVLTTLVNNVPDPSGSLTADAAGDLFGTTAEGGASGDGTVFEIVKTGDSYASTPTILASFNGTDGKAPDAGLIADAAGNLFGTTAVGGANSDGTVFEIAKTAAGYASTPTTLVSFNGSDGLEPEAGLIADAAGNLFGATSGGGSNDGSVFEIVKTAAGYASTPTTLVSFNGTNGLLPTAGLIADAAGNLFGTTFGGGANNDGTVFEIVKTADGYANTPTMLASFNGTDGKAPDAELIADAAGNLFGTTRDGGAYGDGTVFEIAKTSGGYASAPTTLVSFNGTDGTGPEANLIVDAAGDLFGTTNGGGANGAGTIFEIAKTGSGYADTPTRLFSLNFTIPPQGGLFAEGPQGGLLADAAGNLFGTTGGNFGSVYGAVFEVTSAFGVTRVTAAVASPASGIEAVGQTITFTLTMNAAVTVSGGTPTLALNDGGTASYDAAATAALGDPSKLVFSYTVSASDQAVNTLAIVHGSLNGATVLDPAGRAPDFAGVLTSFPGLGIDPPPQPGAFAAGIDLTSIAFDANTTLAYTPNQPNTGGTLAVSDGTHDAAIILLGQYAAADFHAARDFHGGTLVTDPTLTGAPLTAFLASSHT